MFSFVDVLVFRSLHVRGGDSLLMYAILILAVVLSTFVEVSLNIMLRELHAAHSLHVRGGESERIEAFARSLGILSTCVEVSRTALVKPALIHALSPPVWRWILRCRSQTRSVFLHTSGGESVLNEFLKRFPYTGGGESR